LTPQLSVSSCHLEAMALSIRQTNEQLVSISHFVPQHTEALSDAARALRRVSKPRVVRCAKQNTNSHAQQLRRTVEACFSFEKKRKTSIPDARV
jgi:hypothetical protein